METTVYNPIQRHLLEMFSYDKSQEGLEELKEVLFQYYSKRLNTVVSIIISVINSMRI